MVALFLEDNKTSDGGDGKENSKKKKIEKTAVLHGSSSTWFQTSRYCRAELNS